MSETVSDVEELRNAVGSGGRGESFGGEILFRCAELLILDFCLPPGAMAPPHNHAMWAVIGVYHGQENNVFYQRNGAGLQYLERKILMATGVIRLDSHTIHSVSNPFAEPCRAIHVYGGDLFRAERQIWEPFTQEEFDLSAAAIGSSRKHNNPSSLGIPNIGRASIAA